MVIGFSVIILLFPLIQTHCINCTFGIIERRCKAIPAFGFNIYHCRETLSTLPCNEEYYGST